MFGFHILVDERDDGWIELASGACIIALHAGRSVTARPWPKIQLEVDDVADAVAYLASKGLQGSEIQSWKNLKWVQFTDPEGNVVQVCNRRD